MLRPALPDWIGQLDVTNLLSGLIGAVLGVAGALLIQRGETRRGQAAAARAVFIEVAANNAALDLARTHGVYAPLATSTWLAEQSRLAHALSPAQFVTVATFYMRVDLIRGRGFPVAGAPSPALVAVAEEAFERGGAAALILESRGWSRSERAALADELKKLAPM